MTDASAAGDLRWQVGDVEIRRVEERVMAIQPAFLVPDLTPDVIDPEREWASPYVTADGRIVLSVHAFVVRDGATTIVVDTGSGVDHDRPLPGDAGFLDRLTDAVAGGLAAVDTVVCTHLHFDHVGWHTRLVDGRPVPTFADARYVFAASELDHLAAHDHHDLGAAVLDPLVDAGRADVVQLDGAPVALSPSVTLWPTPGHTPGHVSLLVESGGQRGVITGDCAHSPVQFARPEIGSSLFDWDLDVAEATRRGFVDRVVDTDTLVLGTHFPPPTGGRLATGPDGRVRFLPAPHGTARATT